MRTPTLYYPCRNCGLWRRQHNKDMKCLFGPARYEPVDPEKADHHTNKRVVDRLNRIEARLQKAEDRIEKNRKDLDKLLMSVLAHCKHVDQDGESMLQELDSDALMELGRKTPLVRRHIRCNFCLVDWYVVEDSACSSKQR